MNKFVDIAFCWVRRECAREHYSIANNRLLAQHFHIAALLEDLYEL